VASVPGGWDFQPTLDYTPGDIIHLAYRSPDNQIRYKTWANPVSPNDIRAHVPPSWVGPWQVSSGTTSPNSHPSICADGDLILCAWRAPFNAQQPKGEVWRVQRSVNVWPPAWGNLRNVSNSPDSESDYPQCATRTTTTWHENLFGVPGDPWVVLADFNGLRYQVSSSTSEFDCVYPHGTVRNPVPPEPFIIRLHSLWTDYPTFDPEAFYQRIHYKLTKYIPTFCQAPEYPSYLTAHLGQPEQSPYCLSRDGYKDYGKVRVDYSRSRLGYELPYLNPSLSYLAEFVLHNGESLAITESFRTDGMTWGRITLKSGQTDTFRALIPKAAYKSTKAEVEVVCEAGPFACLANDANVYVIDGTPGVEPNGDMASDAYPVGVQAQATPNPFHGSCMLSVRTEGTAPVTASIFNAAGRRVLDLDVPSRIQGRFELAWDGCDGSAKQAPPGIYYLRTSSSSNSSCIKLVKE